jgi:hypothetical protein
MNYEVRGQLISHALINEIRVANMAGERYLNLEGLGLLPDSMFARIEYKLYLLVKPDGVVHFPETPFLDSFWDISNQFKLSGLTISSADFFVEIKPELYGPNCFRKDFDKWKIRLIDMGHDGWPHFDRNKEVYEHNCRIAAEEYMQSVPFGKAPYDTTL